MDWLSELAEWANQNEGLLQALAMLGGIGALLLSLRRQQSQAVARSKAVEPVPAKVVVRPVGESLRGSLLPVFGGYGGQATAEDEEIVATFPDAGDAARAALEIQSTLGSSGSAETEILICERSGPVPEATEANRGAVRITERIRRALLNASDFSVSRQGVGAVPFVVAAASPLLSIRRWALPIVGALLILVGATWLLMSGGSDEEPIRSIAVLPLQNLSGNAEQDYFADGVTEDLIGALSQIGALRVPSHRSVLRFKGTTEPLPEIAAELGVDALIEGSVRREGDQVRVTVQLVRGETDEHLWHESYDEELRGILALQARIARSVADRVKVSLTPGEAGHLETERSVVPAAYDAYLRARQLDRVRTGWASPETIQLLERAVALDSDFVAAHYWLADAYFWSAIFQQAPAKELMPKARAIATRALELGAAEANGVLGGIAAVYDWDWAEARERFQRVREARPDTLHAVAAQQTEGRLFCALGEWELGLEQLREGAASADPVYLLPSAWVHDFEARARRYDAAIEGSKSLLAIDPKLPQPYNTLWWAHSWKGEFDEAVAALEHVLRLTGSTESRSSDPYPEASPLLGVYRKAGFRAYLRAWIGGWETLWRERGIWAPYIAQYYARLGEADLAFEWLERAFEDRNPHLVFVFNAVPDFDPIRSDPRFAELAERVGIPIVEPDGPLAAPLPD